MSQRARAPPLLAQATRERFAQLDILVNNAGVVWGAPLEEFPANGWEKVLRTNVQGVFDLTVALLGSCARRPARRIPRA